MVKTPTIRSAQLISPFGIGSLCEADGQSFFVRGTASWPNENWNLQRLELAAITERMHAGTVLKRPLKAVAVSRFPRWHFCPKCRRMTFWSKARDAHQDSEPLPRPLCDNGKCHDRLVPMRFVAVCDGGHLDEVDWYGWAHRRNQPAVSGACDRNVSRLAFDVTGQSGGDFSSMKITCSCGAAATLEGISDGPLPQRCKGYQPGEQSPDACIDPEAADKKPRRMFMEPRGSSALHFASVVSALDISASKIASGLEETVANDALMKNMRSLASKPGKPILVGLEFVQEDVLERAAQLDLDPAAAWQAFKTLVIAERGESNSQQAGETDLDQRDILGEEYPVLADSTGITSLTLVTRPSEMGAQYSLNELFDRVVQVEKLREVRAFRGFQRRKPVAENPMVSASLNRGAPSWLPATQVMGEGVFVEFSKKALSDWLLLNSTEILNFSEDQLVAAEKDNLPSRRGFHANPVFIMVHTFAHLLINQLSFDCGYSSTSLRERIYCGTVSDLHAGVLIYTADSDSEGSMGGLSEMGTPDRFAETVRRAVERSEWCSGDPVCRELEAQGIGGMNRAACHACSLVAETSCTFSNILLNRILVSGRGGKNGRGVVEPKGFFSPMLEQRR
ncbi:DrmB family protein [Tunturiibacter lichenicola]|uniref:DrmB family protein n=1 Tax=Tunturiibacter lichenicola TaxID=2051959 RepID=UPI003D9B90AB